jgi:hypothetical protein
MHRTVRGIAMVFHIIRQLTLEIGGHTRVLSAPVLGRFYTK